MDNPSSILSYRRHRVGVDFHVWDGIFQGSRSHLLGIYKNAIAQAPDIDFVFFLSDVNGLANAHPEFTAPNVSLVKMRQRGGLSRLLWQLPFLARKAKVDLLHVQYRLPLLPLLPYACTIHDTLFESHPRYFKRSFVFQSRLTSRLAVRCAHIIFTVSAFTRGELERIYGVPPDRVSITYNGVDLARFGPQAVDEDTLARYGLKKGAYLLSVGRLEPRKNHLTLFEAYAQLKDPPPLVVVGQRDFGFEQMFGRVKELGLEPKVRFLEKIGDTDLPALYAGARAFVYPAYAEGFGMPVAEAMACGVPVITTNSTSLPEVAGDGAVLVDPTSVQELSSALQRVLSDEPLRERLIKAGLAHVRCFNWEASANVLVTRFRSYFSK